MLISKDAVDQLNEQARNMLESHPDVAGHPELGNTIAEIQRAIAKLGSNAPIQTTIDQAQQTEQKIVEDNEQA